MKQKIILISIAACVVLVSGFFSAGVVYGQYGLDETAGAAGLKQYGTDLPTIAGNIIGTGLSMISVMFFGLMIYGGIRWMIARGKEEEAKKALDTIVAAFIGIVIVLASYAITNFVFKSVSGGQVIKLEAGGGTTGSSKSDYCAFKTTSGNKCLIKEEVKSDYSDSCPGQWYPSKAECEASFATSWCPDPSTKKCVSNLEATAGYICPAQWYPTKDQCLANMAADAQWCADYVKNTCEKISQAGGNSCPNGELFEAEGFCNAALSDLKWCPDKEQKKCISDYNKTYVCKDQWYDKVDCQKNF